MHRIRTSRDAEPVAQALELLPDGFRRRLSHVRFVAGVDPIFAGLHDFAETTDGRSYRCTAHACFPEHLTRPRSERVATVVLPVPERVQVVVHELGHTLDEAIDFDRHDPVPVTGYAQTDRLEAFAEAFTAWVMPHAYPWAADILAQDEQTLALFDELSR